MKKTLDPIPPPKHLTDESKALWMKIVGRRAISPERLKVLEVSLQCSDRANQARELIEAQGLLVKGEKMDHLNPLLKLEKDNRQLFAKIWKELGLFLDLPEF